jgi:hypothetical protein
MEIHEQSPRWTVAHKIPSELYKYKAKPSFPTTTKYENLLKGPEKVMKCLCNHQNMSQTLDILLPLLLSKHLINKAKRPKIGFILIA